MFVQQYDPFTGAPSLVCLEGEQDCYGPAMLSVMEYAARMYGIHMEQDSVFWGTVGGQEGSYTQIWGDREFKIVHGRTGAEGFLNGKKVFEAGTGIKVITDLDGRLLDVKKLARDGDIRAVKPCG